MPRDEDEPLFEDDYFSGRSDDDDNEFVLDNPEDVQDWFSEDLLNAWMSIVEYHENWYLPLNRTFNQFCEFVLQDDDGDDEETLTDAVRLIQHLPFISGRNWEYFFSLRYK